MLPLPTQCPQLADREHDSRIDDLSREVCCDVPREQQAPSGRLHGNNRLHRHREDRSADHAESHQERLPGARLSPIRMAEFERSGGIPAISPAAIGAEADIGILLRADDGGDGRGDDGPNGLIHSARPGQIMVELGSHPIPDKERHVATFAAKGAAFIDGEVSGTPKMVAARAGVIYLGGDPEACRKAQRVIGAFADSCLCLGPFGAASKVKLINNLLVAVHIAAAAEAMALGMRAGVDVDLMIKAVSTGSGGSKLVRAARADDGEAPVRAADGHAQRARPLL